MRDTRLRSSKHRIKPALLGITSVAASLLCAACSSFPPLDEHPASEQFGHWASVVHLAPEPTDAEITHREQAIAEASSRDSASDHVRVYLIQAGQTDSIYWFDLAIASRDKPDLQHGDFTNVASCVVNSPHRYLLVNGDSTAEFLRLPTEKHDPFVRGIEPYFDPDFYTVGQEHAAVLRLAVVKAEPSLPVDAHPSSNASAESSSLATSVQPVISLNEATFAKLIKRLDKRTVIVGAGVSIAPQR